jgi:zinc/manganese transport system ATP-binding protein
VTWGATREVLTAENLDRARRMCEAFDEATEACASEAA